MALVKDSSPNRGVQPRRRWMLLAGFVALLAVAVPVAWASHQFTDVPDASPFHGDIAAVKGAGITAGKTCEPPGTPPTFCPSEPITREAMAAFVHRGLGRVGYDSDIFESGISTFTETPTSIADITIDVGGVAGQKQFVVLDAHVVGLIESATGCPCTTAFLIELVDIDPNFTFQIGLPTYTQNDAVGSSGQGFDSGAITARLRVDTATSYTFRLLAFRVYNTGGTVTGWGGLTATVVPFGSTGTDVLATAPRTILPGPAHPFP